MLFAPETTLPYRFSHKRRSTRPVGFTLIEAMVAMSIMAIAASALLLGVASALQTTDEVVQRTVAAGLARQLMDEVVGNRYVEFGVSPYQTVLTASSWELATGTRERYDDIDDFNGFSSQPPVDPWGVPLGEDDVRGDRRHPGFRIPSSVMENWRREITVSYVDASNPATPLPVGQVSDYRAVEVRVLSIDSDGRRRELARLHRVVAYVPPLSL